MKWHCAFWRRLTETYALKESSGQYETDFFEPVYRILYLAGASFQLIEMKWLYALWRGLTDTEALKESSGQYETDFFETMYRIAYLEGLSLSDYGVGYTLYRYTTIFLQALYLAGEIWYLCTVSMSLDEVISNASVIIVHVISIYRYRNQVKNKHIYKKLAMSMESQYFDVSTPTRENMVRLWVTRSERYLQLLLGLGSSTAFAWYIKPLIDNVDYNLSIALRVPYNFETPLRYAITYSMVLVAFNYASYFVIVNDIIMQSHLTHLLCQYEILANCFENIIEDCSVGIDSHNDEALFSTELFQRKYTAQLRKCVKQHQFILHQTQELRRILSIPMLCQLGASGMLICFTGYQATAAVAEGMAALASWLLYLGYNMFVLFLICRWCDEIKLKSEAIGEAVYKSGWERGLAAAMPSVRLRLLLVAARASRPKMLTAGGIYDLSLSSYASLLKGSYSALTMLLGVRHK